MVPGLIYTLRLLEPVLANSLAGDANSAQSLTFVPGGLIRGALIGAYLRHHGKRIGDAAHDDFRRLFLSGETRYLHAYAVRDAVRGIPVPLAWKRPKHEGGKRGDALNLAYREPNDESLENLGYAYWWKRGDTAEVADVNHQVNIHTQRDAVFGRAREGQGAVFRYEALPAGMVLEGVIIADSKANIDDLKSLFPKTNEAFDPIEVWLGKGRTAGYGRICIESIRDLHTDWQEGWRWEPKRLDIDEEDDYVETTLPSSAAIFMLTFLSAGLVRDHCGQFTLDPLPALKTRLGANVQAKQIFRGSEIVGGFNRTWGLPLPQVGAIQAGSVFVLEADAPISMSKLQEIEETGIGERRAEGFGRVCFDVFQPPDISWSKVNLDQEKWDASPKSVEWSESATSMAELILRRLLRQEIDERLLGAVQTHPVKTTARIPNSQLSRWRTLIRSVFGAGAPSEKLRRMTIFCAKEQERRSYGWRAMERARVGTDADLGERPSRLTEWIGAVLTSEDSPWEYLGYKKGTIPSYTLGEAVRFEADEELRMEYKLRLIDGVLMATAKQAKQPTRGGSHG